jgi:hypothetical protein
MQMGKKRYALLTGIVAAGAATAVVAKKQKQMKAAGQDVTGLDVDEKVQQLKEKVEELQILAANATADSRDDIKVTIRNLKGDAINHSENLKRLAQRSKSKLSSELIKMSMNFDVKKEEWESEFEQKKYESQKAKDEAAAVRKAEDADLLMEYALEMVEKATVASLEATASKEAYEEKYGEPLVTGVEEDDVELDVDDSDVYDDDDDNDSDFED